MPLKIPSFSDTKPHLFADEVEVYLAFFSRNCYLSKSDIQSLVDKDSEGPLSSGDDVEEDLYAIPRLDIEEAAVEIELKAETCFEHIVSRKNHFGEFYPFDISDSDMVIKPKTFTKKQSFYLFLLRCSTLNLCQKSESLQLANHFEKVCSEALGQWIPAADIKQFGPTAIDRKKYFGSDTRLALHKLAEFINATPIHDIINKKRSDGSYQVNHSGDKGLDLIAKIPFLGDNATGLFSIFGQCASKKEHWWHKKHEADPVELQTYMSFRCSPINMVFIPVCFRDLDGSWYDEGKASACLLIDRLRICLMLHDYPGDFAFLPEPITNAA